MTDFWQNDGAFSKVNRFFSVRAKYRPDLPCAFLDWMGQIC